METYKIQTTFRGITNKIAEIKATSSSEALIKFSSTRCLGYKRELINNNIIAHTRAGVVKYNAILATK